MTIPLISDLLERFFGPAEDPHSRDDVKRRLKIVLAHDRLALDPQTLEMMRQEIIAVVSRYVEVDFDALEFSLATDQRVTALTANLPIRRIRPLGRGADQPIAPDAEAQKIELASQSEILAMDAEDSAAALKQFDAENPVSSDPIHAPLDIDRSGLDDEDSDADESLSDEVLSDEAESDASQSKENEPEKAVSHSVAEGADVDASEGAVKAVGTAKTDVTEPG